MQTYDYIVVGARGVPDLTRIRGLARRLGAVTRDGRESDVKSDASFVAGPQVKEGCHPVTPVTRISTRQPKADFEASEAEKPANINEFDLRNSAQNARFQKLEDWNIRYLGAGRLARIWR